MIRSTKKLGHNDLPMEQLGQETSRNVRWDAINPTASCSNCGGMLYVTLLSLTFLEW